MKFPLDWLLLSRWLWITILACSAVVIGPFIVLYMMFLLPQPLGPISVIALLIGSGIAGGYKDWVIARRNEEKVRRTDFQP